MWQLETAATNASSGSTLAGLLMGTGTTDGEAEAGTTTPPSKVQVCSREYRPLRKSGPLHFQRMIALCSDIVLARYAIGVRNVKSCKSVAHWLNGAMNASRRSFLKTMAAGLGA